MSSLLRQWQLLEMLMTFLGGGRSLARLAVWNLGHIDNAVAVVLAHLHYRAGTAAVIVFHSGPAPPAQTVCWPQADLRAVPPTEWMRPVPGQRCRRMPDRLVLESVVLGPPIGRVGLLVAASDGHPLERELDRLEEGGYVIFPDGGHPPDAWRHVLEPVDTSGSLFRKVSPCLFPETPTGTPGTGAPTLADHQDRVVLIDDHVNLARALAHRFARRGERPEDLEQVAYMALVKAAGRFDPAMGRPFSAFATPSIVGELKRHFRDKMWSVRVPRSVQEMHLAIRDAREELGHRDGRSPSISQIASHLGTTDEEVLSAMEAATNSWATSLDRPSSDQDASITEIPVTDGGFDRSLDRALLMESVGQLSPTEQLILKRVFFEERTQREVAAELGVSQMHISRVLARTLAKMRQAFQVA